MKKPDGSLKKHDLVTNVISYKKKKGGEKTIFYLEVEGGSGQLNEIYKSQRNHS